MVILFEKVREYLKQRSSYLITRISEIIDLYPIRVLGVIIILGCLIGTKVILENPPSLQSGSTDSWWVISLNLIHGRGYSLCMPKYFPFCETTIQSTAAREPVPVLLFSLVAILSNDSLWAATVVEFFIYVAILVMVYLLALEYANPRTALIASLFWAVYPPAFELIPQVSGDLLAAFFVTLGILFVLRSRKNGRVRDWLIAGLGLGLGVMSRSAALVIPVMVIGGIIIERWREDRNLIDIFKPSIIIFGMVSLIMLPWLVRTQIVLGRPLLGSSLVGYNMLRQSYALNTDNYLRYVGGIEGKESVEKLLVEENQNLDGIENEAQMDLIYRAAALKTMRMYPFKYILSSGFRFFLLWFNWKVPEGDKHLPTHQDYAVMIMQAVLMILAWIGVRREKMSGSWLLWGSLVVVSLAYMAVESQLRFLLPVVPLFFCLSAFGFERLVNDQYFS